MRRSSHRLTQAKGHQCFDIPGTCDVPNISTLIVNTDSTKVEVDSCGTIVAQDQVFPSSVVQSIKSFVWFGRMGKVCRFVSRFVGVAGQPVQIRFCIAVRNAHELKHLV